MLLPVTGSINFTISDVEQTSVFSPLMEGVTFVMIWAYPAPMKSYEYMIFQIVIELPFFILAMVAMPVRR